MKDYTVVRRYAVHLDETDVELIRTHENPLVRESLANLLDAASRFADVGDVHETLFAQLDVNKDGSNPEVNWMKWGDLDVEGQYLMSAEYFVQEHSWQWKEGDPGLF